VQNYNGNIESQMQNRYTTKHLHDCLLFWPGTYISNKSAL